MKPLQHKKHTLAKRGLSLLCVLALCLGLLPVTALAADEIKLFIGGQQITESGCYANQDGDWTKVEDSGGTEPASGQFYYDADTVTLTLNEAEITNNQTVNVAQGYTYDGSVIAFSQTADVSLKIELQGDSTITGTGGIRVESTTGNASLSIAGPGSLDVEAKGSNSGITLCSSKNTNLDIDGADVTASSPAQHGVYLISSTDASSTSTITVKNGSLTTGGNGNVGIYYYWSGTSNAGTSSLTVSGNAVVDTRNSQIMAQNKETVVQVGAGSDGNGGIVFNGKSGTVYGNVTLQDDLTINEGETLTIPEGSTLNTNNNLTNNGTVTTEEGGTLTGTISGNQPPKITTTTPLPDGTVGTAYSQTLTATGDPTITWNVTSGTLPNGLTLEKGTISGTPTATGTYTFTVTATNASGSDSKQFSLMVTQPVTSVTLDQAELALYTGDTASLTATVAPDNATNKNVTWSSSDNTVATVDNNGNVTAVKAGTATITATAADGSGCSATCTVTVTDKTYTISADPTALNFGSAYTGYAQPAAQTVTVENTGNQPVILTQPTADNYVIGMLSATTLEPNATATFTVQPKAGLAPGNYDENILITGSSSASASVATSFTVRERPYIPPTPPTVSEETTDAIADAQPGETVTVDLSHGSTKLDKEVFETLAGQDITLEIALEGGVTWSVNGTDIPADANLSDLDLGVEMDSDGIPGDVVNSITGERGTVQMTLAHNGDFGFTMTLTAPLGKENAGYWANLYHYDEDAEALNFEAAAKIDEDGSVTIPFSHASQYAIVIDTHSHATVDVSDIFVDVAPNAWYKDAVQYAYDNGLMTGVSATEFDPEATTTRAMIVSILARLEGVESAQAAGFADVDDNDWYATAVNWAANVGVVNGYEDNTFRPNTAITREQLAAILMNYAAYKGEDVSNRADLTSYTDQPSTWATETMSWAVAEGLISGVTADTLQPQGAATRAQVAAILQRFLSE